MDTYLMDTISWIPISWIPISWIPISWIPIYMLGRRYKIPSDKILYHQYFRHFGSIISENMKNWVIFSYFYKGCMIVCRRLTDRLRSLIGVGTKHYFFSSNFGPFVFGLFVPTPALKAIKWHVLTTFCYCNGVTIF